MKPFRNALIVTPLALLAACGGPSQESSSFADAAPTYAALSIDQAAPDASTAQFALAPSSTATAEQALLQGDCHPHLFVRTREVVERLNRHLYKVLRHVERSIRRAPAVATGTTRVWESVEEGIHRVFTIAKVSDTVFTWKLEMEVVGSSAGLATVFEGQIDRSGATGPHQGSGHMSLDLTKLHELLPSERVQGQIAATFASTAAKRTIEVTAKDVAWEMHEPRGGAAMGLGAPWRHALEKPRSGHYLYFREPGVGGSLKIQEQMAFLCPANPDLVPADVKLVARWYRLADGAVHGRSDAIMTGGQLAPPVANIQGVTCHQGSRESDVQEESYWMMKSEDDQGGTLDARSSAAFGGASTSACDAAFGDVPSMTGDATDYDFGAIDFSDGSVVPFPGMK